MLILFSSYGSASGISEGLSSTPVIFSPPQRVSIRPTAETRASVFFTKAELLDVIRRVQGVRSHYGQTFQLDSEVTEYLWNITKWTPWRIDRARAHSGH